MNYFPLGMKKLRATQNYNDSVSHKTYWYNSKDYADYPIDITGKLEKTEIKIMVDMKVIAIEGLGNGYYLTSCLITYCWQVF